MDRSASSPDARKPRPKAAHTKADVTKAANADALVKARATVKAHESVKAHERELEALVGCEGPEHIVDYVRRELATFETRPFSAVDSLVLSQIAYWKLERVPLGTLRDLYRAEIFTELFGDTRVPLMNLQLFSAVAASPRFRDIEVIDREQRVSEKCAEQFAACTFRLPDRTLYVAYRGTDNSFLGWKEDFNMAFMSPIPSQTSGVDYLQRAAKLSRGDILVGGHSKGGNIAVYAAMSCDPKVRDRITRVFSHDGPGFERRVLEGSDYEHIAGRVEKTVPQSSVIGMVFEHQEKYQIIHSDNHGIMQHDPYSWAIEDDAFLPEDQITGTAEYTNDNLSDFLAALDDEHRERFVDGFFKMLDATGCTQVTDFKTMKPSQYAAGIAALVDMEPETRDAVIGAFAALLSIAVKNIPIVQMAQDAAARIAQSASEASDKAIDAAEEDTADTLPAGDGPDAGGAGDADASHAVAAPAPAVKGAEAR